MVSLKGSLSLLSFLLGSIHSLAGADTAGAPAVLRRGAADSIVAVGEPCLPTDNTGCTRDGKTLIQCNAGKWISLKDCGTGMVCKSNNCAFNFSASTSSAPAIIGHTANVTTVQQITPSTSFGSPHSSATPIASSTSMGSTPSSSPASFGDSTSNQPSSKLLDKYGFDCTSFPDVLSKAGNNSEESFKANIAKACNAFSSHASSTMFKTPTEFYMFLANVIHESAWLQTVVEYKSITNLTGCASTYHNATNPEVTKWNAMAFPDGSYDPNKTVYFGRGYLQLTWAYNYGPASLDLLGNLDLLIHPERVANEPDLSWGTAFWYWKAKVHSAAGVTKGQFGASINAINGDLECSKVNNESAKSRLEIYKKLLGKYAPTIKVDTAGCKGLERL